MQESLNRVQKKETKFENEETESREKMSFQDCFNSKEIRNILLVLGKE